MLIKANELFLNFQTSGLHSDYTHSLQLISAQTWHVGVMV